jgi:hypothetical protein
VKYRKRQLKAGVAAKAAINGGMAKIVASMAAAAKRGASGISSAAAESVMVLARTFALLRALYLPRCRRGGVAVAEIESLKWRAAAKAEK